MTPSLRACGAWLRENLTWSNTRLAWQERLGLGLLAAAVVLAGWLAPLLSLPQLLVLGGALATALAVLLRRGWLKLVGPIALYELIHTTRRSHFVLYRVYCYFILILLALFYCALSLSDDPGEGWQDVRIPAKQVASFAASFVYTFMALQLVVLGVLTPAYTAGILAEEKDRGTLEFLLATDLRDREIVLGKLLARLGNVLLILLTGLPIIGFLQFLGGIDPLLVLVGFAATGVTLVGLAGVSILNSVYARRPRNAIVLTYLEVFAYLTLSLVISWSLLPGIGVLSVTVPGLGWRLRLDVMYWLDAGNPVLMVYELSKSVLTGMPMADCLPDLLRDYTLFHLTLALGCLVWASARLRAVFRQQVYGQAQQARRRATSRRVGRWPMVWKEVVAEPGLRFGWFGKLVLLVLIVGSFTPLFELLFVRAGAAPQAVGIWSRVMGGFVACLLLMRVAVHASTSLSGERERQTLDALLTSPLSSRAILFGKWLGSVLSVRWGWLWPGVIWGIGVVSSGLDPLALPLLLGAWAVYAATLAVVGLWFSLVGRTSLRATVLTVLSALGLGLSYAFLLPVVGLSPILSETDNWFRQFYRFQQGVSPLMSLSSLLPFHAESYTRRGAWHKEDWEIPMALLGVACWAIAGVVLWLLLEYRFRQLTCRTLARPTGEAPPEPAASAERSPVAVEV
jgi:ABC-type transport system involved in multi-copper enzyme maturation permease subunit